MSVKEINKHCTTCETLTRHTLTVNIMTTFPNRRADVIECDECGRREETQDIPVRRTL